MMREGLAGSALEDWCRRFPPADVAVHNLRTGEQFREPSLAAVQLRAAEGTGRILCGEGECAGSHAEMGRCLAVGRAALGYGTGRDAVVFSPLRDGQVAHYGAACCLFSALLRRAGAGRFPFRPVVCVRMQERMTPVEERAMAEAILQVGARRVLLYRGPLDSALREARERREPHHAIVLHIEPAGSERRREEGRMAYIERTLFYFEGMLPGILAAALLFFCLRPWRYRRLAARGLASGRRRERLLLLLWLFSGGMAVLTLVPPGWVNPLASLRRGISLGPFFSKGSVNLVPFATLELGHQGRFTLYIFWGNIAMFVPFGLLPALLWRGFTWRRALTAGICVTGFIECWQMSVGRAFDVDDLLLNSLGVLTGRWLWTGLDRLAPRLSRKFHVESGAIGHGDNDRS